MGYYINPETETKEAWLKTHGLLLINSSEWKEIPVEVTLPVCLVDNGGFTAAAISFLENELNYFRLSVDSRSKS